MSIAIPIPSNFIYAESASSYQYWLQLYRDSNIEVVYLGQPGNPYASIPQKIFRVKTGIPRERPTPLPQRLYRNYWLITKKYPTPTNPETAPYFLELDIPGTEKPPYGPVPYTECIAQCNWVLPGAFGLHGVNGDSTKLSSENRGSSGCIRHTDEDITYLYHRLHLDTSVRYYVSDF